MPHPSRIKYTSESDDVMLEDMIQRVTLCGAPINDLVTGLVIAVKGSENTAGKFDVMDYCFAGLPPMIAPPTFASNDNKYIIVN